MAKKAPAKTPITAEQINAASKTPTISNLIALSSALARASVRASYTSQLRLHCTQMIEGKGYRKGEVPPGNDFTANDIIIGKRDGLIFSLRPKTALQRAGENVLSIELDWNDIVNHFPDLADALDQLLEADSNAFVSALNEKIKESIAKNPAMHKLLNEGFKLALQSNNRQVLDEQVETLPDYGTF